jgi:hypothetical protein
MIFGISTLNQVYVCETQWIFETFFFIENLPVLSLRDWRKTELRQKGSQIPERKFKSYLIL